MDVVSDIAKRGPLRLSCVRPQRPSAANGATHVRLNRAAGAVDGMAALAVRCLERIKQLEQELREFRGAAQRAARANPGYARSAPRARQQLSAWTHSMWRSETCNWPTRQWRSGQRRTTWSKSTTSLRSPMLHYLLKGTK
jgi:hypothetical protein